MVPLSFEDPDFGAVVIVTDAERLRELEDRVKALERELADTREVSYHTRLSYMKLTFIRAFGFRIWRMFGRPITLNSRSIGSLN
jgi:hypothetical protein